MTALRAHDPFASVYSTSAAFFFCLILFRSLLLLLSCTASCRSITIAVQQQTLACSSVRPTSCGRLGPTNSDVLEDVSFEKQKEGYTVSLPFPVREQRPVIVKC